MPKPIDVDTTSFLILDIARLLRAEFERRVGDAELGVTPSEARTLALWRGSGRCVSTIWLTKPVLAR